MNQNKAWIELQNERSERRERTKMSEIAHSLGIPDEGWYVSKRRNPDGTCEYRADWTALGLTWLLNMDDRKIKSIVTRVMKSSLDNKGVGVGWCRIEFYDGAYYESEGTCDDASTKGYAYCDDVAETRAFKRAAVRATGKGLIDHPTGEGKDNGTDVTVRVQGSEGMLREIDGCHPHTIEEKSR